MAQDIYKYVATNNNGEFFVAINTVIGANYCDYREVPYSGESLYFNSTLRVYKYDLDLNENSRVLLAEGLEDHGVTTMKATDERLMIATGGLNFAFSARLQVIDLLAVDSLGIHTYPLTTHLVAGNVKEIIDLI